MILGTDGVAPVIFVDDFFNASDAVTMISLVGFGSDQPAFGPGKFAGVAVFNRNDDKTAVTPDVDLYIFDLVLRQFGYGFDRVVDQIAEQYVQVGGTDP